VSARLELRIAFDINAKAGRMKEKPNESESDRKQEKFRCRWGEETKEKRRKKKGEKKNAQTP